VLTWGLLKKPFRAPIAFPAPAILVLMSMSSPRNRKWLSPSTWSAWCTRRIHLWRQSHSSGDLSRKARPI
jgi:hypothetical protein